MSGGGNTPYRPFESAFDDFSRPNPFPSPEPPVPPPSTLSLSPPPPTVVLGPNNNWSLSPPEEDKSSAASAAAAAVAAAAAAAASGGLGNIGMEMEQVRKIRTHLVPFLGNSFRHETSIKAPLRKEKILSVTIPTSLRENIVP